MNHPHHGDNECTTTEQPSAILKSRHGLSHARQASTGYCIPRILNQQSPSYAPYNNNKIPAAMHYPSSSSSVSYSNYKPIIATIGQTSISSMEPHYNNARRSYENIYHLSAEDNFSVNNDMMMMTEDGHYRILQQHLHHHNHNHQQQQPHPHSQQQLPIGCTASNAGDWDDHSSAGESSSDGGILGDISPLPKVDGKLNKWTNLLHGWQERYFVLSDGSLSYYKSKEEEDLGCRGSLRLANAIVRPHEYDDCRFEVRVGEVIWYLRGSSLSERLTWIQGLELHRIADAEVVSMRSSCNNKPHLSGGSANNNTLTTATLSANLYNGSGGHHHQQPRSSASMLSINSAASVSVASASSFHRGHRLKAKLAEMETFKEILCKQVDTLQAYFDACAQVVEQERHHQCSSTAIGTQSITTGVNGVNGSSSFLFHLPELPEDDSSNVAAAFQHVQYIGMPLEASSLRRHNSGSNSTNTSCSSSSVAFGNVATTITGGGAAAGGILMKTTINNTPGGDLEYSENTEISSDAAEVASNDGIMMDALETLDVNDTIDMLDGGDPPSAENSTTLRASSSSSITAPASTSPNQQQQQSRGFLSRFFTFRSATAPISNSSSNPSSATLQDSDNNFMSTSSEQVTVSYNAIEQILQQHGAHAPDFKGEAFTFKATTAGILATLGHCIDVMLQGEDQWRKRLDREREKRRRLEETYRAKLGELQQQIQNLETNLQKEKQLARLQSKVDRDGVGGVGGGAGGGGHNANHLVVGSPDMEEGPNCTIGEEEFFDALDAQLDKLEQQEEMMEALRVAGQSLSSTVSPMTESHPLFNEVQNVVNEHLALCDPTAQELTEDAGWKEITRDGEMRIYKRELESADGKVLDPLQAVHTIDGVTARELCHYFWDIKYRMDWEFTIDQPPTVLEVCGEDTVVLHQAYKRVWPTSQRDAVFWSHMRHVTQAELRKFCSPKVINEINNKSINANDTATVKTHPLPNGQEDYWLVMNYSTDYKAPSLENLPNQMIRLKLDVVLIGQTLRRNPTRGCTRDNICCRLLYAASIDPGGWAPASVLRKLAQREYPRFVRQFSQYVVEQTKNKPLLF